MDVRSYVERKGGLVAWCDPIPRDRRDDEPPGFAYYDAGPTHYAIDGIEVTFDEFARACIERAPVGCSCIRRDTP